MIGTIRRELLDHVIVLNEGHLRRRLHGYPRYYHGSRTHLARRSRRRRTLARRRREQSAIDARATVFLATARSHALMFQSVARAT
jgi:hypothetical protein